MTQSPTDMMKGRWKGVEGADEGEDRCKRKISLFLKDRGPIYGVKGVSYVSL